MGMATDFARTCSCRPVVPSTFGQELALAAQTPLELAVSRPIRYPPLRPLFAP